jgi:UDP-glucuronate decarboxylase
MSKLILVTGAGGFIGINLVQKLLEQGHSVIGIDNFCSSDIKKSYIFLKKENYELIRADICSDIRYLIKKSKFLKLMGKIDEIYNLACPASPPRYLKLPMETIKANTTGLMNVLEVAKEFNSKVVQTSTSEIYGDPLENPQKEEYRGNVNPVGPRSCYDEGKRISETICYEYKNKFKMDIKIARVFNTYGPFMDADDGRVVSNFINQALRGEPLTIYGDGSQTRSFQYISDLIDGLIKLMETDKSFFGPVNLGNPNEFTIMQLADLIIKIFKLKKGVIYKALPVDDPQQRKPDISLAKEKLNWTPEVVLEEGIGKTIGYFKK